MATLTNPADDPMREPCRKVRTPPHPTGQADGKDVRRDPTLNQGHTLSAPQSFPILWWLGGIFCSASINHALLTVQPPPTSGTEAQLGPPSRPVPGTTASNTPPLVTDSSICSQLMELRCTLMRRSHAGHGGSGWFGRHPTGRQLRYKNLFEASPCTNGPRKFGDSVL